MQKDKVITIRVSEKDKKKLMKKSYDLNMSLSEYLVEQGLERDIIRIEGIDEFTTELRRIGNNINQLTKWVNCGYLKVVGLDEVKQELGKIWQGINDLWCLY